MAGTPHPTTLTVTKYRTTGAAAREATTEKFLHAIQKNAAGNTVSSVVNSAATTTINIAPDAVEVVLELRPVADTNPNVPVLDPRDRAGDYGRGRHGGGHTQPAAGFPATGTCLTEHSPATRYKVTGGGTT